MKLIDRYIEEIGKHLPNKTRIDIQTEIRSTLEDMLEDRVQVTGRPLDDSMLKEVLIEYGAPDKIAASYLPERYLIGPRLFPLFSLVMKVVFSVLTALALVGFGIRFGTGPQTVQAFGAILGKTFLEYVGGVISAFGNIVFIFAILQWSLPASSLDLETENKTWDPADLELEPGPDEITIWTPVLAIVMTVAALLFFNLYPQFIGFAFVNGDKWTFIPALTDAFFSYLPWINVLWVLQIVLNMLLFRQGRWTRLTRWFEAALTIMSIAIGIVMLKGPALVNMSSASLGNVFRDPQAAATLAKIFNIMPPAVLILIIVLEGIDLVKNIIRLLIKPKNIIPGAAR